MCFATNRKGYSAVLGPLTGVHAGYLDAFARSPAVSTRTYIILAALTGCILVAFAVQVTMANH
jgi:hypothetical protein